MPHDDPYDWHWMLQRRYAEGRITAEELDWMTELALQDINPFTVLADMRAEEKRQIVERTLAARASVIEGQS